ncbi:DUF4153 domain-containing protein [Soonwooa sp.]|uniref:DUF4153 domain-containing protein n=1 Tax=Soonwooa sp. TaxID=1938592 RepID=UPI0028AD12A9|nr:DUF4153 domain-containing protein [Soonwooa sp.]
MKKIHLILCFSIMFFLLFYDESAGINLALLGAVYSIVIYALTPKFLRSERLKVMLIFSLVSCGAFAYYGYFISFFAIVISVFLLRLFSLSKELKPILTIPLAMGQGLSFPFRFFSFKEWLPKTNTEICVQKVLAVVVIPSAFLMVFFAIYTYESDTFAIFFGNINFNFNIYEVLAISFLGFFIAFNVWNITIPSFIYSSNHHFRNDFVNEDIAQKPTFDFLDLNLERLSGVVSLLLLNVMLVFFLFSFNYEQFYVGESSAAELSGATHERVNAVILSIIMAVLVIMFYFKSNFNFDNQAVWLRRLVYIWILLNMLLVFSALIKNLEYVTELGLTYKRLGVFGFLLMALLGLALTFYKIYKRKTNLFLVNTMLWAFYGIVLACCMVNWGSLATRYNLENNKGSFDYLKSLNFNDDILKEVDPNFEKYTTSYYFSETASSSFLSKNIYYETLSKQKP